MNWLRQALSFGAVGILATVSHVAVAFHLMDGTAMDKYVANLAGAATAYLISFLGNARFTFVTDRALWRCAMRYLAVAMLSLVLTSGILYFVNRSSLPAYVYVAIVLVIVPPATFVFAKLWAFQPIRGEG